MDDRIKEYILNANPIQWVEYSEELRDSSELILKESKRTKIHLNFPKRTDKPGLSRPYFLNIGFSIENLIKGLLVSENPEYLKDGRISHQISSGHNLEALAQKSSSLTFSKMEMDFLKVLSEGIPNWSRYPIPKRWEIENTEEIISDDIRQLFLNLWDKIGFKIYELTKNGWNGPNGVELGIWRSSYFEGTLNFELPELKNE